MSANFMNNIDELVLYFHCCAHLSPEIKGLLSVIKILTNVLAVSVCTYHNTQLSLTKWSYIVGQRFLIANDLIKVVARVVSLNPQQALNKADKISLSV